MTVNSSNPSAGTARPDAAPSEMSDDRAADIINAAKRYCCEWGDWASLAHRARFLDKLDDLYYSHRGLLASVADLRSTLAEQYPECERLRQLARHWHFYADHLSGCVECWNARPCQARSEYLEIIHDLMGVSAAVAPAARETQETNE